MWKETTIKDLDKQNSDLMDTCAKQADELMERKKFLYLLLSQNIEEEQLNEDDLRKTLNDTNFYELDSKVKEMVEELRNSLNAKNELIEKEKAFLSQFISGNDFGKQAKPGMK